MRENLLFVLLSNVAFVVGCGATHSQEQDAPMQDRVAGCYRLELWPGESGPEAEEKRAGWNIPPGVALETAVLTGWPSLTQQYGENVFVARSFDAAGQWRSTPFGYWRPLGGDSL